MTDTAAHLDVDNVEGALVTLPVHDDTDTTSVSATSHHADVAGLELDRVHNLVGGDVNTDGVVHLKYHRRCLKAIHKTSDLSHLKRLVKLQV